MLQLEAPFYKNVKISFVSTKNQNGNRSVFSQKNAAYSRLVSACVWSFVGLLESGSRSRSHHLYGGVLRGIVLFLPPFHHLLFVFLGCAEVKLA